MSADESLVLLAQRVRRLGTRRNWFQSHQQQQQDESFRMPTQLHLDKPTQATALAVGGDENRVNGTDSPGTFVPPPSSVKKQVNKRFVIDSDDSDDEDRDDDVNGSDDDVNDLVQKTQSQLIIHSDSDSSDNDDDDAVLEDSTLDHPDDAHNINIASLTRSTYDRINAAVFRNALPSTMRIEWCGRLLTTAGTTLCSRKQDLAGEWQRLASIKLSAKVVDSKYRLERTLAHEMCHAAAWLVDGQCKPPHGAVFQRWAARVAAVYADWQIKTCHTYKIRFAFQWQCLLCEKVIGRHSAKSIDTERHMCGTCGGRLEELL